jgi:hypothetical protein
LDREPKPASVYEEVKGTAANDDDIEDIPEDFFSQENNQQDQSANILKPQAS